MSVKGDGGFGGNPPVFELLYAIGLSSLVFIIAIIIGILSKIKII